MASSARRSTFVSARLSISVRRSMFVGSCIMAVACANESDPKPRPTAVPVASTALAPSSVPTSTAAPLPSLPFFPKLVTPPPNPLTEAKIALGRQLFFDKRLGSAKACSDCHQPDRGWADGIALSTRASGTRNVRHTPTLFNVGYQKRWGWDGRSPTLEAAVDEEWATQLAASPDAAAAELARDTGYTSSFARAFGSPEVTRLRVTHALASFVRSIRSGDAPFDRFEGGDTSAIDAAAERGWKVFRNKAGCTACHVPPLYTDHAFHNLGVGVEGDDDGRRGVTKKKRDQGRFKTPTLRSVALTSPYFHDGSAATLEAAVAFVLGGGHPNPQLDSGITPVQLDDDQRADLIAFLRSLNGR